MSKKTLLNETTVRRFMKLANVDGLSDNFINEGYGMYKDDEPVDEGHGGMYQDDEPDMDMPDMDMPEEGPEAPEDMGPEMDAEAPEMDAEAPEMDADEVEITEEDRDVLAQAADILTKIAGEGGGDMDMGMDEPMDEPMGDEAPDLDMGGDEDDEAMMQEVARRVAYRLRKEGADLSTKGSVGKGTFSGQKDHKLSKAKANGLAGMGNVSEGAHEEDEDKMLDEVEIVDENELVQEVTRRVAARLRAAIKSRK
jgi:hypothetical protein